MDDSPSSKQPWEKFFIESSNELSGIVNTIKAVNELISIYEISTVSKFSIWKTTKNSFGHTDSDRPKAEIGNPEEETNLLLVYESEQHPHLIDRYGNICLLDATYKTTKYALPLFSLCMKTNIDYQVVGAFKCEHKTTASIQEGISIIANWNPNWKADYFMTDFDEKEINAIESVFESCRVYLCDFHREQAWTRWVNINMTTKSHM
eukprot:gene5787-11076_t